MKSISLVLVFVIYQNVYAATVNKANKNKTANKTEATSSAVPTPKASSAPCDTKEDVLKKIEEEKKKMKAFSLQGGDTGCSVK